MPKGTPRRRLASWATSWPMRVTRKAVFLIVSATTPKSSPRTLLSALWTTPGPETPTFMTVSGSLTPWKAPAMKGLSSTALQKTTSLAQPKPPCAAVSSAVSFMTRPMSATASMFMPAFVEPTLTEEQTSSVSARARGMERISLSSAGVMPFCTRAEKPPTKLTPVSRRALSSASAKQK